MPITLSTNAVEESTYVLTITLKDHNGDKIDDSDVTSLKWSLTDENGTVINSREDVEITSPTNTESIALTGDDLALSGVSRTRIVTFEATYDGGDLGATLYLKESAKFQIDDLVYVPSS